MRETVSFKNWLCLPLIRPCKVDCQLSSATKWERIVGGRSFIIFQKTGHNEKENEKLEKMHDIADGSLAS